MAAISEAIFLSFPQTARRLWFGETCLEALQAVAPVRLNPEDRVLSVDEIADIAGDCGVIVLDRLTPVTGELLDRLPALVAVVRAGVDIRWIDVAAASERGVLVTQVEAAYGPAVSELVVGMMIDAARSLTRYAGAYRAGEVPAVIPGQQIAGATVGLIGYGKIARHLAGILLAMGVELLVHDPFVEVAAPARAVDLDTLLAEADYVVPLAVAVPGTRGLLGADAFARMKPTAWLVNCSRGDLVDEEALAVALDAGTIAGAAMDVGWARDQMPSPALARHPRVIATPHVGGITRQSFEAHGMQAVAQSRLVLAGAMPPGAANAEAATRLRSARVFSS